MKRTFFLLALGSLSFGLFSACNRDKCPQHSELKNHNAEAFAQTAVQAVRVRG